MTISGSALSMGKECLEPNAEKLTPQILARKNLMSEGGQFLSLRETYVSNLMPRPFAMYVVGGSVISLKFKCLLIYIAHGHKRINLVIPSTDII